MLDPKYDELFYLNRVDDISNRLIPLMAAVNDQNQFFVFTTDKNGKIVKIPGSPVESDYLAQKPLKKDDLYFNFNELLLQRCLFDKTLSNEISAIRNDLHNLSACIRKIEIFNSLKEEDNTGITRMVATEMEYIFSVSRSLFDLFQKIASKLWKITNINTKIRGLPLSFSEMIYSNPNKFIVRTKEELSKKFGLPESWSDFYIKHSTLFTHIRNFRNDTIHYGKNVEYIFKTDRGFAINADFKPFAAFDVWSKETFLPNNIAPLKPIIATVIMSAITVIGNFAELFAQTIRLPADIAPGYHVFMAGPYTKKLQELDSYFTINCWY